MLFSILFAVGLSQRVSLNPDSNNYVQKNVQITVDDGNGGTTQQTVTERINPDFGELFTEKFSCFQDQNGVYRSWARSVYGNNEDDTWYCCGLMANGRRQCDLMKHWKKIGDSHFALCDNSYSDAISTTGKPRRDLCCINNEFNDCSLCKSFMVWDFTVDTDSSGGDPVLEEQYRNEATEDSATRVTFNTTWRDQFYTSIREFAGDGNPPSAYDNNIYPAGFARATLREFNDPPVCVYAPNVAGRVIELKVEPEESGSQICVDDMHEDSLERNTPGVTQACDDSRLQTCFPDANPNEDGVQGFAFLISCSESCADGDVDLWFRLRASVNRWTESGNSALGTDQAEFATEMWCMWGNQNMQDDEGHPNFPDGFPSELDGNFAKWDVFPSDLAPEEDPVVRDVPGGVSALALGSLISILALFF